MDRMDGLANGGPVGSYRGTELRAHSFPASHVWFLPLQNAMVQRGPYAAQLDRILQRSTRHVLTLMEKRDSLAAEAACLLERTCQHRYDVVVISSDGCAAVLFLFREAVSQGGHHLDG
jgi:hypothetical protein